MSLFYTVLFSVFALNAHASSTIREFNSEGYTVQGSLETPDDANIQAIALILPGSASVGMDGDGSSPFTGKGYQGGKTTLSLQMALLLSQNHIASFRYNKRGFIETSRATPFSVLKTDAIHAARWLKKEFPNKHFYLIGLSEGALISIRIANEVAADALFLISPPAAGITTWLDYQLYSWPLQASMRADKDKNNILTQNELSVFGLKNTIPAVGSLANMSWESALSGKTQILSTELDSVLKQIQQGIMGATQSPYYKDWYAELKQQEELATKNKELSTEVILSTITAPIYSYHGKQDAQTDYLKSKELVFNAKSKVRARTFFQLGHCMSFHEGAKNEIKTCGPYATNFTDYFIKDIQQQNRKMEK